MKKIIVWGALAAAITTLGCTVEAGIDGTCVETSCGDALVNGLPAQGDVLCSAAADATYADLLSCACGACEAACGDNLCVDAGESSACGDCLDQLCTGEHNTCADS